MPTKSWVRSQCPCNVAGNLMKFKHDERNDFCKLKKKKNIKKTKKWTKLLLTRSSRDP